MIKKFLEIEYQAYEICVKRDLLKEQVFILGRMGNSKQALAVIINELGDIKEVILDIPRATPRQTLLSILVLCVLWLCNLSLIMGCLIIDYRP